MGVRQLGSSKDTRVGDGIIAIAFVLITIVAVVSCFE